MRRAGRSVAAVCVLSGFFAAYACVHGTTGGIPTDGLEWVATWEGPPQLTEPANMPPAPGIANRAVRQIIHVTLDVIQRGDHASHPGDLPHVFERDGIVRAEPAERHVHEPALRLNVGVTVRAARMTCRPTAPCSTLDTAAVARSGRAEPARCAATCRQSPSARRRRSARPSAGSAEAGRLRRMQADTE